MRAQAPGKLVVSGAYSVLEGAPALVVAVDRYVVADTQRPAERVTEEVAEALRQGALSVAPWFDAAALREPDGEGTRKLGLGSSAAILVASLAAAALDRGDPVAALGSELLAPALAIHRAAQGGGSGVDVAAACLGGVLRCQLAIEGAAVGGDRQLGVTLVDGAGAGGPALRAEPHRLPPGLCLEAYRCSTAASTGAMLQAVGRFAARRETLYRELMVRLGQAAVRAVAAVAPDPFLAALADQIDALAALGRAGGVPIVTAEMARLDGLARGTGACFGPAGAGGGDVALWLGGQPSTSAFQAQARQLGLVPLSLELGARGVHRAEV